MELASCAALTNLKISGIWKLCVSIQLLLFFSPSEGVLIVFKHTDRHEYLWLRLYFRAEFLGRLNLFQKFPIYLYILCSQKKKHHLVFPSLSSPPLLHLFLPRPQLILHSHLLPPPPRWVQGRVAELSRLWDVRSLIFRKWNLDSMSRFASGICACVRTC